MNRSRTRRGRNGIAGFYPDSERQHGYRLLKNPFIAQKVFSDDEINAIHETSLREAHRQLAKSFL